MKNSNLIKLEIARNLKEMSTEQSLESISVRALSTRCNINRGTFYYHFIDIFDLINWIFEIEIVQPLSAYLKSHDFGSWSGITRYCLNQMFIGREFYCQALKIDGQNNLRDYMQKRNRDCWELLVQKYIDTNSNKDYHSDEYINFLIKYTAQAVCNMTIAWTLDGMKIPVDVMANMDDVATKGIYGVLDSLENK